MAAEKIITDEVMEFLKSEATNAYASGDILSYTTKEGQEYSLKITQVFGSDDPELNDGFHALAAVLLDENGDETDQTVFVTRGTSGYPDSYAGADENVCGWPIFMEHKDEVLAWYNDQKDAGKEVSFTGISLGGALSQMFAGYIHQETGDTLKSVVTFSSPGIEKSVTYEGVGYDFSGTIAETVHHYIDSGDVIAELGSFYIEGDVYLYGCDYYLDQAGDSGKVVRFKDYLMQPHAVVKYLLSDEYSALPQAVLIKEMKSSDMTGSWSPLSVTVDEPPEGIENTNNAIVTVGDNTYVFNKAYAEIMLSMSVAVGTTGVTVDINYASKYISRQKWEEMRSTEEGRQDFLGTALIWDWTSDVNVGISGSFSQDGKDYAVITLTGKTEQGREFLYSFSDGCFLETEEVVTDGNWQSIAGAQTYEVVFDKLEESGSESAAGEPEGPQNKIYSTKVTNEMIEAIKDCTTGEHQIGEIFEYTSQEGLTYRLKFTELYGSDDPEMNDGFHATGLVLLDVDGVTETDEHFLVFRATSGFPDAIADLYKDAAGIPLFAAHKQEVLDWYEKYEGEKITFSGSSLGCGLSQYYAGWLVNDQGKDQLTRLVGFLAPAIVKETTYEGETYHFITDETVAETVEFYRHSGDIVGGFDQDYQKGTLHLYGNNAQFDQADGIRLHEYLTCAHMVGTYLKGGTSALTYLGDFDTDYFAKDANYSDLAVEVDAVPEGLENTNVEAVTCGDQIYLFNTEYADVALTVVSYNMTNYDETLEDFFADASLYTCRNQWEECRGSNKQEALARLMIYNNTSDIEISTGRGLTLGGKDYVELANTGSSWACNFFFNFTDREFVAGNGLASGSSLGETGGVNFSINGDTPAVALAGEVVAIEAEKIAGYYVVGFTSDDVTITGNEFTMPDADVTVTAIYAQCVITITADSATKTYDGSALTKNSYTYSTDGSLKAGDVLTATVSGSIIDAGTADNVVTSYKVMRGEEDVTSEYKFNDCVKGTLTVTQCELTVTGTTADGKTYDGNTDAQIGMLGVLTGVIGSDNVTIDAVKGTFDDKDAGNGKDVTVSYTLTGDDAANYTVASSVTSADIEKRSVTLTSADATKEYDGTALTNDTVTVSGDGWAAGEGATYNVTGSQTEVGSSANTFTYTLNANTKANNYDVTSQEGTLTVTPASTVCRISNYNNTAKSDIIQIAADGKVYVLGDSDSGYALSGALNDVTGWNVVEVRRDLTGDGLADVQITCDDGVYTWVAMLRNDYQQGGEIALNYQHMGAFDSKLWRYVGAADVNADGKSEVLMIQTDAGADPYGHRNVASWVTDAEGKLTGLDWVGGLTGEWNITGTADVTGNGEDNVILVRNDGMIGYWSTAGSNDLVEVWNAQGSNLLTSGEFDGDGKDDLLFNNAYGDFFTWTNVSTGVHGERLGNVSELGVNWSFGGTGDYDGDSKDEILWCNSSTGKLAYSEANTENFKNLITIA